jgi:hypothetical protein
MELPSFYFRATEEGENSPDRLTPSLEAEDSNSNTSDSKSVSSVSGTCNLKISVVDFLLII